MMPLAQASEPCGDRESQALERLKTVIRNGVLRTLGEPGGFGRVQVRPLWGNYYRVNVLTPGDPGFVKVARSYFLEADGEGNIVTSSPQLGARG